MHRLVRMISPVIGSLAATRSEARASLATAAVAGVAALVPSAGNGAATSSAAPIATPIRHVVVIYQENHSFDNVLGKLCVRDGRCDGVTKGTWPDGSTRRLGHATDLVPSMAHDVAAEQTAIDDGAMDGFPNIAGCRGPRHRCMTQFKPRQIPDLAALARRFVISDRTFMSDNGASWGMHLALVAANPDGFYGDNPEGQTDAGQKGWGCDSGKTSLWSPDAGSTWQTEFSCVPMPDGTFIGPDGSTVQTPVPWIPTIMDRLDAAGLTWKLYSAEPDAAGYGWAMCPTFADCMQTSQRQGLVPANRVLDDAESGALPAFSIVTPVWGDSQHNKTSMAVGDDWIGKVVSAIENGPDWSSTAIFITYDDCGCFYDHVVPPAALSLRVPMVIVSPYAKARYTDHATASFASLLAFVEHNWSIEPLAAEDASAYDYSNSFDFGRSPLAGVRMVMTPVPASERRWIVAHPDSPDDPT
jgi:phospholipase C